MEDTEIVKLFLNRDEEALSTVKTKYGRYILTITSNILKNNEDALECENDTYLKLWNSIPPENPISLRAYIAEVSRNTAVDRYKENKRKKRAPEGSLVPIDELEELLPADEDDKLEARVLGEAINTFLGELPEKERILFIRRYWFCEDIKTVSEKTGYSQTNIRTSLMRTRNKLKEYLKRKEYEL